jgi:Fe-Mn family superoxide dismutase
MSHTLPALPYGYDALTPSIGAETMELHHSKHHQAYVTNLNNLSKGTEFEGMSLEDIVVKAPAGGIFNNAGQHWNHNQFWTMMAPAGQGGEPTGVLADAIVKSFGSVEDFKTKFEATGIATFGSGWAWLAQGADGSLELMSCSNADNPLRHGKNAILGIDVWEHAYYVDYRNRRPDYLKNFWNVVNWNNMAARFNG